MLTFTSFALLALSLTLLVWVALLLRRQALLDELNQVLLERANLQEAGIINISKDLMGLQEELGRVTKSRNRAQEDASNYKLLLACEAQSANKLQDQVDELKAQLGQVEPELRHQFLVEDALQSELAQVKKALFNTKEEYSLMVQSLQEEIDQLSWDLSTYEKVCSPEQLDAEEELAIARQCIWDKSEQIAEKQELLNEVAAELFSLGFKDSISPNEVFKIRELALGQDIPF